ncbi:MAG: tetratricopeptide repeat protein, partial [Deltaproteobacteria bacterium]
MLVAVAVTLIFNPFSPDVEKSRKSIAVLPFSNLTGNEDEEYFSDGITDDILTQLYKIGDLKVISRTTMQQYKETKKSVPEIGAELHADAVLEGSVRRAGKRIRITAQLIDAHSDDHLWAENYDRDIQDVFEVQTEIAQKIAGSLQATLSPAEKHGLAHPAKTSPEAYNAYLQGRYFLARRTRENVEKAIAYFEQALRLDSTYARAWVELSRAHSTQADAGYVSLDNGYRMARIEVERALRLDPNLAETHGRLGWIKLTYDWDWTGADAAFRRALELEPGNASVVHGAAALAGSLGRFEEAMRLGRRVIELDPLLSAPHFNLGLYAYYAGRWAEAESAFRGVLVLNPQYPAAHVFLGCLYLVQSKPEQGLAEMQKEPEPAWRMFGFPLAYSAMGMKKEADSALVEFIKVCQNESAYQIAEIYAFRAEPDSAFQWLDRAYRQRDGGLSDMKGDPLLRGIMKDPRYAEFM